MTQTSAIVFLVFGVVLICVLSEIALRAKHILEELQGLRGVLVHFLGTDDMKWNSWPHRSAQLLEEIQSEFRDFRRTMIDSEEPE